MPLFSGGFTVLKKLTFRWFFPAPRGEKPSPGLGLFPAYRNAMGGGKNVPVLRQGFYNTSAAKIRRTARRKWIFLQCGTCWAGRLSFQLTLRYTVHCVPI